MSDESKKKQIKHIQEYNKENYVTLRVPISRKYENDIIEHINFYEDTCYDILQCYDRKMEEIKDKYIGRKVVVIGKEI